MVPDAKLISVSVLQANALSKKIITQEKLEKLKLITKGILTAMCLHVMLPVTCTRFIMRIEGDLLNTDKKLPVPVPGTKSISTGAKKLEYSNEMKVPDIIVSAAGILRT